MLETPQEIEVWYILPAIRKELAQIMAKKGLKQVQIAELLGITKSAVNHYIKQKRAKDIKFNDSIIKEIENSVEKVIKNREVLGMELQRLCTQIRKSKELCKIHHKLTKSEIPERCKICIEE